MLYVLLTALCSTSIALTLKWNDQSGASGLHLLLGNYLVAAGISAFLWFTTAERWLSWPAFFFGLVLGALFLYSFFAFTKAVAAAGASLSTVSARLSVAIPVVLSMLLFREHPTTLQVAGFVFVGLTLLFFYLSLQDKKRHKIYWLDFFYLFVLWLGIGLNDFSMKVFQHWRGQAEEPFFLLIIFSSAFVYTYLVIRFQKLKFDRGAFLLGLGLGVPNMFSTFFLLAALNVLPAVVVYPSVNLSIILLTAVASYLIWRERLNRVGLLALFSGSLAIVLLNL